jgi:putative transposase
MLVVHKIELKPNNKQRTYLKKACGVARFAYNWALSKWQEEYAKGLKPKESEIRKQLNAIKAKEYPWMLEVTKVAPQQAIKNLGMSYKRFFTKKGGYPKFKKKGINDSFRADNGPAKVGADAVKIIGKKMQIPILGYIRLKEVVRFKGQVKSVTISRVANRWFAAISIETKELPHVRKNQGTIGVDLGINAYASLSNGKKIQGPKAHTRLLTRLRGYNKGLSRKKKGSKNFAMHRRFEC